MEERGWGGGTFAIDEISQAGAEFRENLEKFLALLRRRHVLDRISQRLQSSLRSEVSRGRGLGLTSTSESVLEI
jgi:hypothetical protein